MQNNDPPRPGEPSEPAPTGDALRRLEQRLDRASAAAERLIAEAALEAAAAGSAQKAPAAGSAQEPPPVGWQAPEDQAERDSESELELLGQVIQAVRDLIPPDLQRRLAAALRELLLALRALIDFYLERIERRGKASAEVEDIPIA